MVFIAKPNLTLVPMADGILLKIKALVSWNKTIYFLPSDTHFLTRPFWYNNKWMSPCPCGFVSISNTSFFKDKWHSLSNIAGHFSCFTNTIWFCLRPKLSFSSRSFTVLSCVSPEVIMHNGIHQFLSKSGIFFLWTRSSYALIISI